MIATLKQSHNLPFLFVYVYCIHAAIRHIHVESWSTSCPDKPVLASYLMWCGEDQMRQIQKELGIEKDSTRNAVILVFWTTRDSAEFWMTWVHPFIMIANQHVYCWFMNIITLNSVALQCRNNSSPMIHYLWCTYTRTHTHTQAVWFLLCKESLCTQTRSLEHVHSIVLLQTFVSNLDRMKSRHWPPSFGMPSKRRRSASMMQVPDVNMGDGGRIIVSSEVDETGWQNTCHWDSQFEHATWWCYGPYADICWQAFREFGWIPPFPLPA